MAKNDKLTKVLAITGTILVWIPTIAPGFFSIISLVYDGIFRFDYLMPAELFPLGFVGSMLLLWAAFRARSRLKLLVWGLVAATVLLFGAQGLAIVTGLAHGDLEPPCWQWTLVLSMIVAFTLALIVIGVGGVMLVNDLFKNQSSSEQ